MQTEQEKLRAKLEADTAAFLSRGGQVLAIKTGHSGESHEPLTRARRQQWITSACVGVSPLREIANEIP